MWRAQSGWAPSTERAEIAVEDGIMQGLKLGLGDDPTFEVGGLPLRATLTSVRRVQWDSLSPNFMLVPHPAALADYPATLKVHPALGKEGRSRIPAPRD